MDKQKFYQFLIVQMFLKELLGTGMFTTKKEEK